MTPPLFELAAVGVETTDRVLLHPLDLSLDLSGSGAGVCGLIGHNGSGKTTLLRLLAGQQAPSRGVLRFEGRAMADWPRRALARRLAYMPQSPPLDPGMRVRDLVGMGRFPWHGTLGRVTDADRAAVTTAMRSTGVATLADRPLGSLSGGERQRAAIALCVAQGSRCLLLDEPTSALDVAHQVQVLEAVRRLSATHGIGVVVVLHDINLAARFCDELVALRQGRLIARGTPAEIMSGPVLESIYGTRLGVLPHPAGRAPIAYVP